MWFLANDKLKHGAGGFITAFFIAFLSDNFAAGFVSSWAMGHIKEEMDRADPKHHTEEARDALATSFGGLVGATIGANFRVILANIL